LTEWWRAQPEEAGTFAANHGWHYDSSITSEQRVEILRESHKTGSIYHVNLINEYLNCVPELAWKHPNHERINTPGTITEGNWTLKVEPTVEQIVSNSTLKKLIQNLLLTLLLMFVPLQAESEAHIKMLYSSLSPSSIPQHLAFYQLYPNSPYGEKALSDSWALLGKGSPAGSRRTNSEMLSHFPELTGAIVALINQKENDEVILSESEINLIEQFSFFLPNRKLKGSQVRSAAEVIALPPEEIDLARGLFLSLLENTPEGWQKMRSFEALLDLMALQVLAKLPFNASPKEKIKAMNELVFFEMGYRFPPQSLSTKDIDVYTFLPTVLNSRKGVCLGVSILYLCLAQRLDLPLEMVTPPGHIYVRYKSDDDEINIETTCRGVHVDSDYYLSIDTCSLEQQNIKQVIALAYINQASVFLGTGKYDLAEEAYKKALPYYPDHSVLHRFLGLSLCLNGKEEEGREFLTRSLEKKSEHQISPDTLAEDYLNGHINAQGVARFVTHVESNRAAILEEKQAYEKILQEFPLFRSGWLGLAGTWLELGNERQALKALEAYHEIDQGSATVEFYLANLYAKRLDFEKGWDRLCRCEKITQTRDYIPEELRDFREQLQQISPE
jgi:tetratricopeptide (TPR) repeat protein